MMLSPFAQRFEELPEILPIFPLDGVVLLLGGDLPLNIFEPRYLALFEDSLRSHRLIGMVQPVRADNETVFRIGCAGRITRFEETPDGRYLVNLRGLCRFRILQELPVLDAGYRTVRPGWAAFENDLSPQDCLHLDRRYLCKLLRDYLSTQQIDLDWDLVDRVSDESLLTTLSMVCPFTASEKQALLEAPCCVSRSELFLSLLELALPHGRGGCGTSICPH